MEALSNLVAGSAAWDGFRSSVPSKPIDLSFANLKGADLHGLTLEECDLTGADLSEANLDNVTLTKCIIDGATFEAASFVGAHLRSISGIGSSLVRARFRKTRVESVTLRDCDLSDIDVVDAHIRQCEIHKAALHGAEFLNVEMRQTFFRDNKANVIQIKDSKFVDCQLSGSKFTSAALSSVTFLKSEITDLNVADGNITSCRFSESKLLRTDFNAARVSNCDFSASLLEEIRLSTIDMPTAVLLNTALVDCDWPEMRGRVTITGRYVPSDHLPQQPIQDINGVPPLLRREIADAQFLVATLAKEQGILRSALMRLWGFTSGYGQDLSRLMGVSAVVILVHALVHLALNHQLIGWNVPDLSLLVQTFGRFSLASVGVTPEDPKPETADVATITSIRVFGFIVFGIWISIAANKVSKLGSQ